MSLKKNENRYSMAGESILHRSVKKEKREIITSRFSILHFMSRASVKNASSTLMEAFAEVSMNFMPYSIASSSPRSLDTWKQKNK